MFTLMQDISCTHYLPSVYRLCTCAPTPPSWFAGFAPSRFPDDRRRSRCAPPLVLFALILSRWFRVPSRVAAVVKAVGQVSVSAGRGGIKSNVLGCFLTSPLHL
ncbi:hypothetical protein EVAR_77121_1 [Eumeta japonica]|uniref:Uncharacterized protein n=1 Tax=Eumeta variegata TaxID=151549 RepID=A0A4C1T4P2_EUMVA|nr:hypothetical protein EVAR_77121_1 [Eumeta japonica]